MIGKLEEFDYENTTWDSYVERFENWVQINEIPIEKQSPTLIALMASKTYEVLKELTPCKKISELGVEEIKETLGSHFNPKPLIVAERYKFWTARQAPEESIKEYSLRLQKLSDSCLFKEFLDEALRDCFIVGLNESSKIVRPAIMVERELSFKKTCEMALQIITASTESKMMENSAGNVLKIATRGRDAKKKCCFSCGKSDHLRKDCPHNTKTCKFCGVKDHIIEASWKKNKNFKNKLASNNIIDIDYIAPYTASLKINNKKIIREIDTGSPVSILTLRDFNRLNIALDSTQTSLRSYSGHLIKPLGATAVKLRTLVCKNGSNIIGRDLLECMKRIGPVEIKNLTPEDSLKSILNVHSKLFDGELGKLKDLRAKIYLKPDAKPIFKKARPISFFKKELVDKVLDDWEDKKVIEKVAYSEWAAPIVAVMKDNNSVRVCADFSVGLNPQMEVDKHPLPRHDELMAKLSGGESFSVIDLESAYLQMEVENDCRKMQFCRLPFGLASAPAMWQRAMDTILSGINFTAVYLDDIIITGRSREEHLDTLKIVLQRLSDFGVKLKIKKCHFFRPEVEYCRSIISREGIRISHTKTEAIDKMKEPENITELRSFCGFLNYYKNHVKDLSTILAPLYDLQKKDTLFKWNQEHAEAFKKAKSCIKKDIMLAHFDPNLPIILSTDASFYGVGAVLSHRLPDNSERPIAFASRTLQPAEKNIIWSCRKFLQYLEGRFFTIQTDHQPLLSHGSSSNTTLGHFLIWPVF